MLCGLENEYDPLSKAFLQSFQLWLFPTVFPSFSEFTFAVLQDLGMEWGGQEGRSSPRVMHSIHFTWVMAV